MLELLGSKKVVVFTEVNPDNGTETSIIEGYGYIDELCLQKLTPIMGRKPLACKLRSLQPYPIYIS